MRTFVRDFTGLALHALLSSPRSRQRDRALSAAGELQFIGLAEALELTLLLADRENEKFGQFILAVIGLVPALFLLVAAALRKKRLAASRWRSACRSTLLGPFCSMRPFTDGRT